MIKVIGHMSPDTDTACCPIIWSWYLNTHKNMEATPYLLGEPNTETKFVFEHWDIDQPELLEELSENDEVVVVDTNNPQELPDDINDTNILQIIDHHKLVGGLETKNPADVTIRPVASTATVMYDLMNLSIGDLPKDIAGLILSCILSDTLEFRSPTTSPRDKEIAESLARALGIDITEYATKMFEAKSDISDFTDEELIHIDSKKYAVGDKNFRVSVLETTTPEKVLKRKDGLVAAIKKEVQKDSGIDDVLFFAIDILKEEATALAYNELTKQVIETSFDTKITDNTAILPGIISRKKQILPALKL